MPPSFTLHGSPHSPFTYKVGLMLRLSGEPFAFRYVSFQKRMHETPAFKALSPWGQVPVLEHEGRVLLQSPAILEYLGERPGPFAAIDPKGRQAAREWLYWITDRLSPPVGGCHAVWLGAQGLLPIAIDPVIAAYHRARADRAFGMLETTLSAGDWLAGPAPGIADLCAYGDIAFAKICGIDFSAFPALGAWAGRIEARPGFAAPGALMPMADALIEAGG